MRKVVVLTFVTLDGVMQAPGGKGEDPSDNFNFEGWSVPYFDEAMGEVMAKQMSKPFDLLLGRKTYDIFASFWPEQTDEAATVLNLAKKYVVSNGKIDTGWKETEQISGDVVAKIKELKKGDGPMLQVHGSSNFIQTLLKNDLVDELWVKIHPITLGKGKRLFGEGTSPAAFKLTEFTVTPSGVICACYKCDGEVKTGSFS